MADLIDLAIAIIAGAGAMGAATLPIIVKLRWHRKDKAQDAECDKRHAEVKAECKPKHDELRKGVLDDVKNKLDKTHDLIGAMINCMCGSDTQFRENWRKWFKPQFGFGEFAAKDR